MESGLLSRHDTLCHRDIIRIRAGDFVFILSYGLFMNLLVNDVFKILLKKVRLSR